MSKLVTLGLVLGTVTAAIIAPPSRPAQASDAAAEKAVLAAQDVWKEALIKKDRVAFDKVLHADLRYGHSDGHIEDKATAIKMIVDGAATWEAVNLADTTVRVRGNTAFVTGKVQYLEREHGALAEINLVVLSVWVQDKRGKSWQMIARQATRPAPAKVLQAAAKK